MRLFFCSSLFVCLFVISATWAVDESAASVGLMKYPGTSESTAELKRKFDYYTKYYHSKLEYAKKSAISAGDAEEVSRIDKALAGEYVDNFSTRKAIDARKYYDEKLASLTTRYCRDLEGDVKKILAAGKTDDAIFIKDMVEHFSQYKKLEKKDDSGKIYKEFKVEADKGWQATGVVLKPDTRVVVQTSGTWAPGYANRRNRPSRATADTYNLQLKSSKGEMAHGGTNWDFTTQKGGSVFARMVNIRQGFKSSARGELRVRLTIYPPVEKNQEKVSESKPLESAIREIIYPVAATTSNNKTSKARAAGENAPKRHNRSFTVIVKANKGYVNPKQVVSVGDKVSITADGEWSANFPKSPKVSADIMHYAVRIGNHRQGQGGKKWKFVAARDGELIFFPSFYNYAKRKGLTPSGSLKLKVNIVSR